MDFPVDAVLQLRVLGEFTAAAALGGLIGFEREMFNKPAGLRTHMLVAATAALLVDLGDLLLLRFNGDMAMLRTDPIRIIEAIITGVAFLGAGTIFRSQRGGVEGLTTAASLLLVATVGICVGLRQWILAIGVTVVALVILRGLVMVEGWAHRMKGE